MSIIIFVLVVNLQTLGIRQNETTRKRTTYVVYALTKLQLCDTHLKSITPLMISRTHCLVYEQRWGPHCAHVWLWIAFFCLLSIYQQMSSHGLNASPMSQQQAHVCVTFISHLPAIQVECFHEAFRRCFYNEALSEKSGIILYRVIWLLRCAALILCVKFKKCRCQHMVLQNRFERNICGVQLLQLV